MGDERAAADNAVEPPPTPVRAGNPPPHPAAPPVASPRPSLPPGPVSAGDSQEWPSYRGRATPPAGGETPPLPDRPRVPRETPTQSSVLSPQSSPPAGLGDLLAPGLDVVFVGFNPSLRAWESGHYYANPTNSFWRLLFESGLTPRLLRPEEDALLPGFGVGATDLLAGHPSARADELPAAQYRRARELLTAKLLGASPRVVCFNGLGVYAHLYGERPERVGAQERLLGESLVWAVPSSSGAANARIAERRAAWLRLGELVRSLRREGRP